jgi:hypothetical protein
LVPSFDGSDDFGWVCSPCEGLWIIVGFIEEAVDGGPEFLDGSKDAAFETPFGEFGEEAFNGIEPR